MRTWYEKTAKITEEKVVVKLYDENNKFVQSIIVPTMYYPLNDRMKVFHYGNTQKLTEEKTKRIFDEVKYEIGSCYSNTKMLVEKLRKGGINAKSYVGWLFTGQGQTPIHHCWAVVDDSTVLDLADDFTVMLSGENGKNFESLKSKIEWAEMIASFQYAAKEIKNSIRCSPVGVPTTFLLYVGSECEPDKGIDIYNQLIRKFPDHECQLNLDAEGYNPTQRILQKKGLIEKKKLYKGKTR